MGEIFFIGYYWVKDGKYISVGDKLLGEYNAHLEVYDAKGFYKKRVGADSLFPHPLLGHVRHSIPPLGKPIVNQQGFSGKAYPAENDEDYFSILITGGSVADSIARGGETSYFEKVLNERYQIPGYMGFKIYNGASSGWTQPRQLINYTLWAHIFDAVVTVDGFNEAAAIWRKADFSLDYPQGGYYGALRVLFSNPWQSFEFAFERYLRDLLFTNPIVQKSKLCFFVIMQLRKNAHSVFHSKSNPMTQEMMQFSQDMFKLPEKWSIDQKRTYKIRQYKRYIRTMHALTEFHGAESLFFLQPTSYYGKTLTEYEQKVIDNKTPDQFSMDLYHRIVHDLLTLRKDGIPIYSFLDVFDSVGSETIYSDTVHFQEEGKMLIVDKIIDRMALEWGLVKK